MAESSPRPREWLQSSEKERQLLFLQASMAPDIFLGDFRGIDTLVQQLQRYGTYFDNMSHEQEHMVQKSDQLVVLSVVLNVTISEATLQQVFPRLKLTGQAQGRGRFLRSRMLGQQLFLPCSFCFEWDEISNCVVRMGTSVDFLSPIVELLGVEDASIVLNHALIASDSAIGDFSEQSASNAIATY
ncbi:hypothetical protein PHYBOEH_010990 [Phytophthora boehmeriae]|uniref:Bzip transcription factor n=1 Tax=Phytophthora boehmeriae TaxID=109152 RepID=A0A8T1VML7_9STRA|nr:hypothetical protein PHYBOEH_010990 [Phytophthora boehmeriae]